MSRLTQADRKIIRSALNDAMRDRDTFADAYSRKGPEAERAIAQVAAYEALHVRMFGYHSAAAQQAIEDATCEKVSIFSLNARAALQPTKGGEHG